MIADSVPASLQAHGTPNSPPPPLFAGPQVLWGCVRVAVCDVCLRVRVRVGVCEVCDVCVHVGVRVGIRVSFGGYEGGHVCVCVRVV